jgi:hypothetical protein
MKKKWLVGLTEKEGISCRLRREYEPTKLQLKCHECSCCTRSKRVVLTHESVSNRLFLCEKCIIATWSKVYHHSLVNMQKYSFKVCICSALLKNFHHLNTQSVRFIRHNLKLLHHFHVVTIKAQILYQICFEALRPIPHTKFRMPNFWDSLVILI